MALRRELHRRVLRYRVDRSLVPVTRRRRVDVVFPKAEGGSSRGRLLLARLRAARQTHASCQRVVLGGEDRGNVRCDADANERLALVGWRVITLWEHDPLEGPDAVAPAVRGEPV